LGRPAALPDLNAVYFFRALILLITVVRAAMNLIANLLPPTNIVVDLEVGSKKRVFEQAGLLFENNQGIGRSDVFDSLFTREKLGSTALGQGIAIPHGRIRGMREARGAFLKLKTPIPFDAPDARPVHLIFVLLVPERATDLHLQILSELAQMFCDKELRKKLSETRDPAVIHKLITQWEPRAPDHAK
jgi:PTS system nitrogen regulatory IIA component